MIKTNANGSIYVIEKCHKCGNPVDMYYCHDCEHHSEYMTCTDCGKKDLTLDLDYHLACV